MLSRRVINPAQALLAVDRRVWMMVIAICGFAILIVKEISLPSPVVIGLGVIGLMALLVLGLQSPEIPLYVLVAYIPFSRLLVGDFGTSALAFNLTNVLCVWVFVAHLLRQMSAGKPAFQGTPLNRMILFFSFLGAVSLMRAGFDYGSWYTGEYIVPLKRWLTPMFFYFLTLWVVRDKRILKTVAVIIMIAVTIVALMAIRDYMYVADSSFEKSRVGGIAQHSNTLGAFFVYYMFLFLGFFLTYPKNKLKIWMLLIPFLLCFRGIMVTFSRGAYLAFAFGGLAACWFRHKVLFVAAVATGVLMLVNPILLPSGIRYRMSGLQDPKAAYQEAPLEETLEASSATRIRIWKGAIQMIQEHPMWGVGYGAFPAFIPRYTHGVIGQMDAHNSYLLIAAEMGIPTLLVFLLTLVMLLYYTYWLYRHASDLSTKSIALGFLAGLAGLLVANLFGSRMDAQEISGYFWILAGLIMRGIFIERQALRPKKARAA